MENPDSRLQDLHGFLHGKHGKHWKHRNRDEGCATVSSLKFVLVSWCWEIPFACWILVDTFTDGCFWINLCWLVVKPPLWKIWKSVGMISNPIYGKIKNVPNHQPVMSMYICKSAGPKILTQIVPALQLHSSWTKSSINFLGVSSCGRVNRSGGVRKRQNPSYPSGQFRKHPET